MIIEDINSIHKHFDHLAAETRVVPVAFFEPAEEKLDTVMVQQLRLGEFHHLDRLAEIFSGILQAFQRGRGGRIPDPGSDRVIDIINLPKGFMVFRLNGGKRGGFNGFLLFPHDDGNHFADT
ncbi:MAG: hypothetical protein J6U01_10455, partial [Clostridia bacterium]|nr:hypothetical protein [Clostridia bacterium]